MKKLLLGIVLALSINIASADTVGKLIGISYTSIAKVGGTTTTSIAKVVGDVSVPTSAPTASYGGIDTYTKLMLHFNSLPFVDEELSPTKPIKNVGSVAADTGTKKFGAASAMFDGVGTYITVNDSADLNFGTGEFTIDCWIKPSSNGFIFCNNSAVNKFSVYLDSASQMRVLIDNGNVITGIPLTANVWQHVAVVRTGNTLKVSVGGAFFATTYDATGVSIGANNLNYIGGIPGVILKGHLDEYRISKGVARWTTNFTPPTQEYTQ